ncbi:MAG: hypothetical protein ACLPSW_07270 [Roseiarcus sp.]
MIANATKARTGLFFRKAIIIISLMAKLSRLFASPISMKTETMKTETLTSFQHAFPSIAQLDA